MKHRYLIQQFLLVSLLIIFNYGFGQSIISNTQKIDNLSESYYYFQNKKIVMTPVKKQVLVFFKKTINKSTIEKLKQKIKDLKSVELLTVHKPLNAIELKLNDNKQLDKTFSDLKIKAYQDDQVIKVSCGYLLNNSKVFINNKIIAKPRSNQSLSTIFNHLKAQNLKFEYRNKLIIVSIKREQKVFVICENLRKTHLFDYTEPEIIGQALNHLTPNDTYFTSQWFLNQSNDADLDAPEAWNLITGSSNVKIAVIDGNGYDLTHPDLNGNLVNPYDAVNNNNNPTPENADANHGTPCAALIGAETNNSSGVAGVGYNVKVVPINIGYNATSSGGFSTSSLIISDAANHITSTSNIYGVSNSYSMGSWAANSSVVVNSFNDMRTQSRNGAGAVILASMGNDNTYNPTSYPAHFSGVIGVVATNATDTRVNNSSWGSNYGDSADIAAPGINAYTLDRSGSSGYSTTDYTYFGGTSAACPIAAGVVGLMASGNPALTGVQIENYLLQSCNKVGGYNYTPNTYGTWNSEMGYGRVNAFNAVQAALGGGGGGTCSSTINSTTYWEGFENTLGAWTQSSNDDIDWTNHSGSTLSNLTGPSAALEGSYYMYIEASGSSGYPNKTAILESPCFDLSAFPSNVTPKAAFNYNMYGASMGTLTLEISTNNGATWSSLWSKTGNQGTGWHPISVCLGNYSGQTIQLRFVGITGSSFTSDMAIDQFQVTAAPATLTAPSLNTPTNFAPNISTTGGITFNWTHGFGSSVDATRIQISKISSNSINNFSEDAWACGTQNIGNSSLPVNTTAVTLSSGQGSFTWNTVSASNGIFETAQPNTTYYWTVRYSISNGSNAGHSYYTNTYQFTTDSGVSNYCTGTTNLTNSTGVFSDGSGSNSYNDNSNCKWLIQPTGANSITLSFSSFALESCCDYVRVYDGTTTSSTLLGSYNGTTLPSSITSSSGDMLVHFTTDGSVTAAGWSASYTSSTSGTCTTPTNLSSNNITSTSATLNWNTVSNATSYNIEWRILGNSTWNQGNTTGTSFVPFGIVAGTTYEWKVQTICSATNTSNWSNIQTFTSLPNVCPGVSNTTLPFFEGFENNTGTYTNTQNIVCNTTNKWDFETTNIGNGRVRIGTDAYVVSSGSGAATLDGIISGSTQTNGFILTLDLSNYSTSNTLGLSFDFQDHGDEPDAEDRVWIRGSQTDGWLEIYDWSTLNASGFTSVVDLDIDALLSSNGQTASNTFQVKFGQKDNYPAPTDGLTIDNISITNTGASCADSYEPNNTYLAATYGGSYFSDTTLCLTANDEDWFSILNSGNTYYLKVSGATSSVVGEYGLSFSSWNNTILGVQTMSVNGSTTDTYLTLYDTDGTTVLATNDNGGNGNFSSIAYTFNCLGQADIGVQSGAFNVLSINGTTITGSLRVLNGGTVSTGAFVLSFYASLDFTITTSDYKLLDYNVPSLAPNSAYTVNFTVDASTVNPAIPIGTYYIGDILDNYNVVSECDEMNNEGAWGSPTLSITNQSVCNTPTSLTSSPTTTNANVQWGTVTGANSYDVQWRVSGTTTWSQVNTTVTNFLLSGLNSGTTYQWRIRTHCGGSTTSNWSSIQTFTTLSINSLIVTPTSLTPTNLAGNSMITVASNISWTASKSVSWLTLTNGSGSNNGSFIINYTENTSANPRTATVTVSGSGVNNQTITITQAGTSATPPFTWIPTNQSGIFQGQAQVSGIPATTGDWIGAFDSNGNCAGAVQILVNGGIGYINLPIYADDPTTPIIDEGINNNEPFTLQLYDASAGIYRDYPNSSAKFQFTQWMNTSGTPMPAYNDPNVIYNFVETVTDYVILYPGWNLISTDIAPSDSSITTVFADQIADNNLIYVTGFNNGSVFYDPNGLSFFNTLNNITRRKGYWVKVNNLDTLIVQGLTIAHPPKPNLNAGWNLIGFTPQASILVDVYFAQLISSGNLVYVTSFENGSVFYDPNGLSFFNTLTTMKNGYGYWVKVNTAASAYRNTLGGVSTDFAPLRLLDDSPLKNIRPNNIYDFLNGTSNLEDYTGRYVTIKTESGEICGQLEILEGGYLMTTSIYGDDLATLEEDGVIIGTKLLFEFEGQTLDKGVVFDGNMQLHQLDLEFEKSLLKTKEAFVLSCYPNPFTTQLLIDYDLSEAVNGQIKIHNSLGQLIKVFNINEATQNQLIWSVEKETTGLYFISLEKNNKIITTQRVVLKD